VDHEPEHTRRVSPENQQQLSFRQFFFFVRYSAPDSERTRQFRKFPAPHRRLILAAYYVIRPLRSAFLRRSHRLMVGGVVLIELQTLLDILDN
jgi:hypothetical protein